MRAIKLPALCVSTDCSLMVHTRHLLVELRAQPELTASHSASPCVSVPQVQKASCSSAAAGEEAGGRKGTISQYFTTLHCPVCDELTQLGVCARCRSEPQRVAVTLHQDMRQWESQQDRLLKVRATGWTPKEPCHRSLPRAFLNM